MSSSDPDNTLRIECPTCSKVIRAPKSMRGKMGKCPGCGNRIQIPGATSQSEAPSEAGPPERPPAKTAVSPDAVSIDTSVASSNVPEKVSAGIHVLELRAKPSLWLIRLTMLVMAIQIFILWRLYEAGTRTRTLWMTQEIIFVVRLILFVVGGIFFLRWKYQASANLRSACKSPPEFSPGGCCWYYFIPVLNFFYPMRAMHEIQARSKAGVGYMVYLWWVPLMASSLMDRSIFNARMVVFERLCTAMIASTCLAIIAGFFLIKIIKAVTEKQRRYRLAIEDIAT